MTLWLYAHFDLLDQFSLIYISANGCNMLSTISAISTYCTLIKYSTFRLCRCILTNTPAGGVCTLINYRRPFATSKTINMKADETIAWKCFPHYWSFVRKIYRCWSFSIGDFEPPLFGQQTFGKWLTRYQELLWHLCQNRISPLLNKSMDMRSTHILTTCNFRFFFQYNVQFLL